MTHSFDAIIVGAGQAGPPLAVRLTAAGWRVALAERQAFGGTCVNTGCTPTKALVASAKAAHTLRTAPHFGLAALGKISVDLAKVKARKDAIVQHSRAGLTTSLEQLAGCTLFRGAARFLSARSVQVGDEVLTAPHIFINVGARPAVPAIAGLGQVPYLTSSSILELAELPAHLVILGGSYIGGKFSTGRRHSAGAGGRVPVGRTAGWPADGAPALRPRGGPRAGHAPAGGAGPPAQHRRLGA